MKKYTIGIDFGTLSGRAVLVDTFNGQELASATCNYPHGVMDEKLSNGLVLPLNFALQDPNDYVFVLKNVVSKVVLDSKVDKSDIVGLGIDFTSCTVLPVDSNGEPLCNKDKYKDNPHAYVKLWKHHGAQRFADKITEVAKRREEKFLSRTGGTVSSESALPKLWEILDEEPEIYNDTAYFIEAGDWLNWLMTGVNARSYLFASFKNCYVDGFGYPDKEFYKSLDSRLENVIEEKFNAPILKMGERVGYLTEKWAEDLGLTTGVAVSTPIIDAHVAAPAVGVCRDGDMFGVLGTSGCFLLVCREEKDVSGICGVVKDGIIPDFYGYEAGLCCLGDHFSYCAENLTSPEYVKEAKERGISMIALLSEKAEKKRPGESGLIALNWWNGNRSTLIDSELSGLFIGMTLSTKPEDYMRALMEATAFGARNIVENYEKSGVKVKRFIATGGIAKKNEFLMQMYSDVLGMEICVAENPQAPALGSAINSAVASKVYPDFTSAIEKMKSGFSKVYKPNMENKKIYDRLFNEYKKLYDYFGRGGNDVMKNLRNII